MTELPPIALPGSRSRPPGADEITFVGTATTIIKLAGFTILSDPNFLHQGERAYLGLGLSSRRLTRRRSRSRSSPRSTSWCSRTITGTTSTSGQSPSAAWHAARPTASASAHPAARNSRDEETRWASWNRFRQSYGHASASPRTSPTASRSGFNFVLALNGVLLAQA